MVKAVINIGRAIITGAGRNKGIGAEICRIFAREGIDVYFTSFDSYDKLVVNISSEDYERTLSECKNYGVKAYFGIYDLRQKKEVDKLFDDAESKIGKIDILVNCLCYHVYDDIVNLDEDLLDANFATNAKSIMMLCQEFYTRFAGREGRIINFSSTQNLEALTTEISYAISKASIPIIVSTLAPIMAEKGITINAVNPGATEIGDNALANSSDYLIHNKFNRYGLPDDAANLVNFLVSDAGKWITGQVINSEGGYFRGI